MISSNVKKVDELSNKNISSKNVWIRTKPFENKDFDNIASIYYLTLDKYIRDLTERSMACQNQYNKLIDDFVELYREGYSLDEASGRYSFNPEEGFIIENPENKKSDIQCSQFIRNIFACIFGNGIPEFYVDFTSCNFITEKQMKALFTAAHIIEIKVSLALRLKGFDEELVKEEIAYNSDKYTRGLELTEVNEMSSAMKNLFFNVIEEDKKREESVKLEKKI